MRCCKASTLPERFWAKVARRGQNECWLWTGHRNPFGYGRIGTDGTVALAHRASWELHNGPIPDGLCVLHRCDNPSCVNPKHLFLGTREENNLDRVAKGRSADTRGEGHPNARLTNASVSEARALHLDGWSATSLSRRYGVHLSTICLVLKRKTWSHVA